MTPEQFWTKVEKMPDGCWEWRGSRWRSGYGEAKVNGKRQRAHRVAYELTVQEIPVGLHVLHDCDNPPCVNPDHLRLGTHAENMAEMSAKGRPNAGNRQRAVGIIRDIVDSDLSLTTIARRHGVAPPYVFNIAAGRKNRRAWAEYLDTEIAKLPVTAQQTPLLAIAEAGVVGRKRRTLIVLTLEDWVALHGD